MRHSLAALLLATIPLLTAGCGSLGLEPPDLTLVDLQLEDMTMLETSGRVTIRLANSNPEPLQVDGMAFDLRLDGRRIGKALSDEKVEVPRLSTVTVDAELNVSHLAIATLIPRWTEAETVSYELSGKVYVLTDFGRRGLRVNRSGRFDFAGDVEDKP